MFIRKLTALDANDFKNIRIEAVQDSPGSFYPTKAELLATSIDAIESQITPSEWNFAFGAFENDTLIAILGVLRDKREKLKHKAKILGVYVTPAHRGKGIARGLFDAAFAQLKSLPDINMLVINVSNADAKSLYLSLGFQTFGIEPNSMYVDGKYIDEEHMMLTLTDRINAPKYPI